MLVGAILTAFGIVALVVSGMHFTRNVEVPNEGAVKVTVKRDTIISIPPVVGGVAVAGGLLLMVLAAKK